MRVTKAEGSPRVLPDAGRDVMVERIQDAVARDAEVHVDLTRPVRGAVKWRHRSTFAGSCEAPEGPRGSDGAGEADSLLLDSRAKGRAALTRGK